jgi:superfamily II DNA or RNA helicase
MLKVEYVNETYIRIVTEPSIEMELSEAFCFKVPGFQFMPKFRAGIWDGNVRLFNQRNKTIYRGLLQQVIEFCKQREYEIDFPSEFADREFSETQANNFIKSLNLKHIPRDYQTDYFIKAVRSKRAAVVSPTGSGKSLMIYMLTRLYNKKTLLIVPTVALVRQMVGDFEDYGYDKPIHQIYSGQEKDTDDKVTVTTWQSIYKMPKTWFDQFDVAICDEVHKAKADALTRIMENLHNCKYRIGFTGTLGSVKTNQLIIEGLFGPPITEVTTSELIDRKLLADFKIKCIVFNYPDEIKKQVVKLDYQQEIDYIITSEARNNFISNLALSLKGNTLILFSRIKHGERLFDLISGNTTRPVYYIDGSVDIDETEHVRKIIDTHKDAIIVAIDKKFSTGINIETLQYLIFAAPSKAEITILQSIGRMLRRTESKTSSVLFDISDNFKWRTSSNYTLKHFLARLQIYSKQKFPFKVFNVELIK